jgi:hypothetical protein
MVIPPERLRDGRSLIHAAGSHPHSIDFLKTDDVRRDAGDYLRDPRPGSLPVHADTPMQIVGGDTQPRLALSVHRA